MNTAIVKRINDKSRQMFDEFGDDLTKMMYSEQVPDDIHTKIKCFVANYQMGLFDADDLMKRRRTKNVVSMVDRCRAKKSDDEQCTRRHMEGSPYCGTHTKSQPHGKIDKSDCEKDTKKEVKAEEIKGIVYYVDDEGTVYDTEQVHQNVENPRVIGKYSGGVLVKYDV